MSAKTITETSSASITCTGGKPGTGTVLAGKTKTKSTLLCQNVSNPPSPCPSGEYVYDSVGQFIGGASTLYKADKTTSWTDKGTKYVASNSGSAQAGIGSGPGYCPNEVGFVLTGKLTMPSAQAGRSTEITDCFNVDAGTNTSGDFFSDVSLELAGVAGIVIASAQFDANASSILFA